MAPSGWALVLTALLISPLAASGTVIGCYKDTYGRGVGEPLHACPKGFPEKDGLLCYKKCKNNYEGVGPVCWEKCKTHEGYEDRGVGCEIPLDIYGKGCCCTWLFGCCGDDQCKEGYTDDGCTCRRYDFKVKDSYGRGVGEAMTCGPDEEQDGLLCYPSCRDGYNGIGPVCWSTSEQPTGYPVSCTDNVFTKTDDDCQLYKNRLSEIGIPTAVAVGACTAAVAASVATGGLVSPLASMVCGLAKDVSAEPLKDWNTWLTTHFTACPV